MIVDAILRMSPTRKTFVFLIMYNHNKERDLICAESLTAWASAPATPN